MKVMHLISGGDVGGAKTHVLTLLQELNKTIQADQVCFMEGEYAQDARDMGIRTVSLPNRGLPALRKRLIRMIKKGGYELLHCHGAKANLYGWLIRRAVDIPVITTVHSDPKLDYMGRPLANLTFGAVNRLVLPHRDGWVAVSDAMKELLISRGFDGDRIWPIYNGIVFPEKLSHSPRQEYLKSLGMDWNESNVIFGIAARISPVKDITTLIRAFADTVAKAPHARLLIAGDGEQRQEMEALSRELCPPGTVCFAGWVSDMNSFYHAVDVNMLTSISETFPYAITEGARMYCATISTAVGGVPKLIRDGQTGYLIEPGDYKTMHERMLLVATDAGLRTRLGRAIHDKVRREYSSEAMARRQLEIYQSVLRRHRLQKQGRFGVVICGAYGRGNAGDDGILLSMIRQLRRQDPDVPITVMSRKPKLTARMTGVSAIPIFNVLAANKALKKSKLYISGGGSLIQDATSSRSLWFYLSSIRQAKRAGCKVMMYGCGVGPVSRKENRRLAGKILEKNVDLITLRDENSLETLRSFGVHSPKTLVTADPALLLGRDDVAVDRYFRHNGLESGGKYCMFCLRPWGSMDHVDAFVEAAEYAWNRHGMKPLFYPMEPRLDTEFSRQVADKCAVPNQVLPPLDSAEEICALVNRMELVVSMRLHSLIFACSQDTPVAGVAYAPKVSGFMEYLGQKNYVALEDVTAGNLKELIDRAAAHISDPGMTAALREKAERNGTLAGELLK